MKAGILMVFTISCLLSVPPDFSRHRGTFFKRTPASTTWPSDGDSIIEQLLAQHPEFFEQELKGWDSLRVQIIYTQIDRDPQNRPSFHDFFFHVDPHRYFYPASTVKMPVALLALQKLHELRLPGLDKNSSMITDSAYSGQTLVHNDPTTVDGRPTVAQYIKKIFLVSDNDAFNRLYEFLGPAYINSQLRHMGYSDVQIRHRLQVTMTPDENKHTNPVTFYDLSGRLLYEQPMQVDTETWAQRNDSVGHGFINNEGSLVGRPMDFSNKNRISLLDLHQILKSILFPELVSDKQRFGIRDEDYNFVYTWMSSYPREAEFPFYDTAQFWDAYGKLLLWGSEKTTPPRYIRIFNKEGDAYGFLTDVAYVADFDHHVEFMLSCTIYCNTDGILNDDKYDYDSLGLPFMKSLGQVIYQHELQRHRQNTPNLLNFRLNYNR